MSHKLRGRGFLKKLGENVGLTAEDMGDVRRLAALASGTPKSKRNDIYMAVAGLYRMQGAQLSERERALMRDILKRLTHDVEMAIRISLASPLGKAMLGRGAGDDVEVQTPKGKRSYVVTRLLTIHDLIASGNGSAEGES